MKINLNEAKDRLAQLVAQAEAGEEVIIARDGKPVARLVPVAEERPKRRPGSMKGKIHIDDSFFDPLPEDELRLWEGRDD